MLSYGLHRFQNSWFDFFIENMQATQMKIRRVGGSLVGLRLPEAWNCWRLLLSTGYLASVPQVCSVLPTNRGQTGANLRSNCSLALKAPLFHRPVHRPVEWLTLRYQSRPSDMVCLFAQRQLHFEIFSPFNYQSDIHLIRAFNVQVCMISL